MQTSDVCSKTVFADVCEKDPALWDDDELRIDVAVMRRALRRSSLGWFTIVSCHYQGMLQTLITRGGETHCLGYGTYVVWTNDDEQYRKNTVPFEDSVYLWAIGKCALSVARRSASYKVVQWTPRLCTEKARRHTLHGGKQWRCHAPKQCATLLCKLLGTWGCKGLKAHQMTSNTTTNGLAPRKRWESNIRERW